MEFWRAPLRLQTVVFRSMLARHSGMPRSLNSRTVVPERCLTCLAEAESFAKRACAVRQGAGSESVEEFLAKVRAVPDEDAIAFEWLAEIDYPPGIILHPFVIRPELPYTASPYSTRPP